MVSKYFLVIDSIDFHVNKMVPENDTAESKSHDLLPFLYQDAGLPTKAAVSATTTTTTINSTKNANANNNTVNNTKSILITSSTTTTARNNRADNKNTNNNTVNDFNKLLTLTSASKTKTNNNTSSVNANNSESNNSSKLMPSSINEERNESKKSDDAEKQDVKEKITVLNSARWNKGTTLIIEDLMLVGLRETQLSKKGLNFAIFQVGKLKSYSII